MKFINWIKKYAKDNELEFKEFKTFTTTHYRVSNGDRYVDFWPNGSLRDTRGKFHRRGASERGIGADNVGFYNSSAIGDGTGFLEMIKKEIMSLK